MKKFSISTSIVSAALALPLLGATAQAQDLSDAQLQAARYSELGDMLTVTEAQADSPGCKNATTVYS